MELLIEERVAERALHKKKRKPKAEIRALPSLGFEKLGSDTLFGNNPQIERSKKPAEESMQAKQNPNRKNELWQEGRLGKAAAKESDMPQKTMG